MKHYPKTPDDEDWHAWSAKVSIIFGFAVVFLLKTCYVPN